MRKRKTYLTDEQRYEVYVALKSGERAVDVAYRFDIGVTTAFYIKSAADAVINGDNERLEVLHTVCGASVDWARETFTKKVDNAQSDVQIIAKKLYELTAELLSLYDKLYSLAGQLSLYIKK